MAAPHTFVSNQYAPQHPYPARQRSPSPDSAGSLVDPYVYDGIYHDGGHDHGGYHNQFDGEGYADHFVQGHPRNNPTSFVDLSDEESAARDSTYSHFKDDNASEYSVGTAYTGDSNATSRVGRQRSLVSTSSKKGYLAARQKIPSPTTVPTVVISEPQDLEYEHPRKAPIAIPRPANFSRPVRPPITLEDEVLERSSRTPSPTPPVRPPFQVHDNYSSPHLRSQNNYDPTQPIPRSELPPRSVSANGVYNDSSFSLRSPPLTPGSHGSLSPTSPTTKSQGTLSRSLTSPTRSTFSQGAKSGASVSRSVTLSRRPPSLRVESPTSLYSRYSFYQLESASPTGSERGGPSGANSRASSRTEMHDHQNPPTQGMRPITPGSPTPSLGSSVALEYLQQGIQHHEANRLKESAICFEKSAKEQGGCGVGMLMYGLTLRHGWGCAKDEKQGFRWLQKAAEKAVDNLEAARAGQEADAIQTELILAIYEVGQCFFHGWGVAKDKTMGVSYYAVAARLGDMDAQQDLAFAMANGKGCKKDRKEAAKWYRAAVKQGASDTGLQWIYKEKFQ